MRIPRIYQAQPLAVGQMVELDAQATAHLTKVLRLRIGDALMVFNGQGGEYQASVATVDRRTSSIKIEQFVDRDVESPLELLLVQGVSRGERMDYTVQKAVELGVRRIVPVHTERTVVNLNEDRQVRRQQHWQSVVNSACEQSGRNVVPEVSPIVPLHQWLGHSQDGLKLVLHHRAETSLDELPSPKGPLTLLIGPEGGLSPTEIEAAQAAGYLPLRLGPRILRTETASVAALSVLQWMWGDFHCGSSHNVESP